MNLIDLHNSAVGLSTNIFNLVKADSVETILAEGKDIKMNLDYVLHNYLSAGLKSIINIEVVSEEGEHVADLPSSHWLIDPLDGSLNYSRGIENYCTSIALSIDGVYKIGLLINLCTGDVLSSIREAGVFFNGKRIQRPRVRDVKDSIVATGIPTYLKSEEAYSRFWSEIITLESRVKKLRMFGSAASSLFMLALGKVDVYYEVNIASWDVRAGLLICEELGMTITEKWTGDFGTVWVSNSAQVLS